MSSHALNIYILAFFFLAFWPIDEAFLQGGLYVDITLDISVPLRSRHIQTPRPRTTPVGGWGCEFWTALTTTPHQQNIYLCHIRASPTANGCQAVYKWQRRSCIKHRGCRCSCQQTVTSSVWMEKEPEVYSEDSGSDPLQSSRMHSPTGWLNIKHQIKINSFNYTTCDQFKLHLHLYLNMF